MRHRLYHFSEDPNIDRFVPRPVQTEVVRPKGMNWLNGPLVWAIDAAYAPLYLFPRECPRIVMSKPVTSSETDISRYWIDPTKPFVAFVEDRWVDRIKATTLYRYTFESVGFVCLEDVGMHVIDKEVQPVEMTALPDLLGELQAAEVELQIRHDLSGLADAWDSSLQVSGIRLRNAQNWKRE